MKKYIVFHMQNGAGKKYKIICQRNTGTGAIENLGYFPIADYICSSQHDSFKEARYSVSRIA